jgi:hypothetical protein
MSTKSGTTEELFLKIFKTVVLFIMALALLVTAAALCFAAYQYFQSPKAVTPAAKAKPEQVNIQEFLNELKNQSKPREQAPAAEPAPTETVPKPASTKYLDEAKTIAGCAKDAYASAERQKDIFNDEFITNLRQELEAVADTSRFNRGQSYITDATVISCELFKHPDVIALLKEKKDFEIFFPIVNFHLNAWDSLRSKEQRFNDDEETRVTQEEAAELERVAASKAQALFTLMVAAGAFGLFMAIALYLIIAAIESNLRSINTNLHLIRIGDVSTTTINHQERTIEETLDHTKTSG